MQEMETVTQYAKMEIVSSFENNELSLAGGFNWLKTVGQTAHSSNLVNFVLF